MKYHHSFLTGCLLLTTGFFLASFSSKSEATIPSKKLHALIVDGQSNHGIWPMTTMIMKDRLEETGLFDVDIERTAFTYQGPHSDHRINEEIRMGLLDKYPLTDGKKYTIVEKSVTDPDFNPDFSKYDVVLSNFGWWAAPWPEKTQDALEKYVRKGGGLIIVHGASNSFDHWVEYNKMIGLGGWGDRDAKSGPYVYYNDEGELIRDTSEGICGSHGAGQEFLVTMRNQTHPITQGIPTEWMHSNDEIYDRLRGPAENMTVLATAYSDIVKNAPPWKEDQPGTGRHEPMLMTIDYGKGRVFHTVMGHSFYSMSCVGFITTLQRGAEWAATGKVTQEIPEDFPTADMVSEREWY